MQCNDHSSFLLSHFPSFWCLWLPFVVHCEITASPYCSETSIAIIIDLFCYDIFLSNSCELWCDVSWWCRGQASQWWRECCGDSCHASLNPRSHHGKCPGSEEWRRCWSSSSSSSHSWRRLIWKISAFHGAHYSYQECKTHLACAVTPLSDHMPPPPVKRLHSVPWLLKAVDALCKDFQTHLPSNVYPMQWIELHYPSDIFSKWQMHYSWEWPITALVHSVQYTLHNTKLSLCTISLYECSVPNT